MSALILTTLAALTTASCGGEDSLRQAATGAGETTDAQSAAAPSSAEPSTTSAVAAESTSTAGAPTTTTTVPPTIPTLPPTTTVPSGVAKIEEWLLQERESWNWGAIVDVTGDRAREFVEVEARFYDETDRLIDTETTYLNVALPGRTAVTGTLFQPAAAPVRMEITIDEGSRSSRSGPYGSLTIGNVSMVVDRFSTEVTGEIQSTFEQEQEFVEMTAIWRDPATGGVSYVASGYVDVVPALGTTLFSISLCCGDGLPADPPAEIHWSL